MGPKDREDLPDLMDHLVRLALKALTVHEDEKETEGKLERMVILVALGNLVSQVDLVSLAHLEKLLECPVHLHVSLLVVVWE